VDGCRLSDTDLVANQAAGSCDLLARKIIAILCIHVAFMEQVCLYFAVAVLYSCVGLGTNGYLPSLGSNLRLLTAFCKKQTHIDWIVTI